MSARGEILQRIAAAHASAPPLDLPYSAVSRSYRDVPGRDTNLVELLGDRLADYHALVRRTTNAELPATVAAALADRGVTTLAVPAGVPQEWLVSTRAMVLEDRPGEPLSVADLDSVDGVLTGCAVAIAETGTLVLDASPDQGRRALTLVPDYHLCVVDAARIVPDVPQGIAALQGNRPLTFVSGPSATSDIELDRVEGVHGPRTLEVVVVSAP